MATFFKFAVRLPFVLSDGAIAKGEAFAKKGHSSIFCLPSSVFCLLSSVFLSLASLLLCFLLLCFLLPASLLLASHIENRESSIEHPLQTFHVKHFLKNLNASASITTEFLQKIPKY
jgi:hypothetical protein